MNHTDGISDKAFGCILGGAIGDAFGSSYEGQPAPVEINASVRWQISDDTQLTLATCEAIIENVGSIDPAAVASRFAVWHRQKRISGTGASTYKALSELVAGGHWALVGAKGERAAGNGAAMRTAPLSFFLDPAVTADRQVIRDVCRITHHNDEAYAGALAVVAAVRAALKDEHKIIDYAVEMLPDSRVKDRLHRLQATDASKTLMEVAVECGTSGYVVESVPLALYAAQRVKHLGYENLLEELVQCGGDTDTIASIAGQVAGTYLGWGGLPRWVVERLPEREMIEGVANRFVEVLGAPGAV